jgi:iron complex outermembrane receptor protein
VIHCNRLMACASAVSLVAGLCSTPAAAQGPQPASAPTPNVPDAKTDAAQNPANDTQIVITAQKRSENVQRVPISVAAFTGQTLVKSNVTDI